MQEKFLPNHLMKVNFIGLLIHIKYVFTDADIARGQIYDKFALGQRNV